MTTNQIKQLFNNNPNKGDITLSDIVDLAQKINIEGKLDKETLNYYYCVDILALAKANIEDDVIYNMVNQGWELSKDKKKIVKFC